MCQDSGEKWNKRTIGSHDYNPFPEYAESLQTYLSGCLFVSVFPVLSPLDMSFVWKNKGQAFL
ncbi:hypothetical protein JCM16496A_38130 [Bacteroides rodentium JCM 16496]